MTSQDYPTKLDKIEMFYEHQAMFAIRKPLNRVRRPLGSTRYKLERMRSDYLNR